MESNYPNHFHRLLFLYLGMNTRTAPLYKSCCCRKKRGAVNTCDLPTQF